MGRIIRCSNCGMRVEERRETSLPSGRYCQFCYDKHLALLIEACSTPDDQSRMREDPWTMLAELQERRRIKMQGPARKPGSA
jgi:hypothetical protein